MSIQKNLRAALPIIVALVFVALGGALVARTGPMVMKALASGSWPQADAVVLMSEKVRTSKVERGRPVETSASARIVYQYEVAGESYTGRRISFAELDTMSSERADALVARFPADARIQVRVNPRNPTEAVLEAGLHGSGAPWAVGALVTGVVLFFLGMFALVRVRRLRAP